MNVVARALVEAAIRNGVDLPTAEASALLAERDQLAARLRTTERALDMATSQLNAADHMNTRVRRALAVLDCEGPDLPNSPVILAGDALAPIAAAILRGER